MLPLNCTLGLVIQTFNDSYMLASMLYFLTVALNASCLTLSDAFLKVYEVMVEILLMLQVFFAEEPEIEYLFCGAPSGSETHLLFCNHLFCLWLESVKGDFQHDLTRMANKADGSVVLAQLAFLWECKF